MPFISTSRRSLPMDVYGISSFVKAERYSIAYIYNNKFYYSPTDGHLGNFWSSALRAKSCNNSSCTQVSHKFEWMHIFETNSGRWTFWTKGVWVCNFDRFCQIAFCSYCTNFHIQPFVTKPHHDYLPGTWDLVYNQEGTGHATAELSPPFWAEVTIVWNKKMRTPSLLMGKRG